MRIGGSIICGTKDSLTSAETGSGGALVGSSGRQVLSQRNCFVRCPTTCSRVSRRTSSTTHPLLILKSNRIFKKKCDGMDQMCHTGNRTSVHKENLHLQTKPLYSTSCYFDSPAFQACMTHYAHSLPDQPTSKWETMREHENLVAKYCRKFLERIDPALTPWGDLLGKWHDLGKYHPDFQKKLHGKRIQIEHAGAGARSVSYTHLTLPTKA